MERFRILIAIGVLVALAGCPKGDTPGDTPRSSATPKKAEKTADPAPTPPAPTPAPKPDPVDVTDVAGAKQALGKKVRVRGTAENAKLGAVVVSKGIMVYCLDRDEWPDDTRGKQVSAVGVLEYTEQFMAKKDASGAWSAGTGSGVYVFRVSEYELVPE